MSEVVKWISNVISRFASIGPVAGAPNLGYLEVLTPLVTISVKMFKTS